MMKKIIIITGGRKSYKKGAKKKSYRKYKRY